MQNKRLFCLVALMAVLGCSGEDSEDASQIEPVEWLKSCQDDSECGDRECVCNVCTVKCEDDASCREEDESTVCSRRGSKIYRALCQCRDAELAGVCLPACDDSVSCREGLSCLDGDCLPEGVSLEQDEPDFFVDPYMMMMSGSPEPEGECKYESINSEGTVTYVGYRSYEQDGNLLVSAGESKTGEVRIDTYTYDEEGRQLVHTFDEYGDCDVDRTYINEMDLFGNLSSYAYDDDGDDVFDVLETRSYDESCNLLRVDVDQGNDGVVDLQDTYSYDDRGNAVGNEMIFFADGVIESRSRTTVAYDDDGNRLVEENDDGDDGVIDYRSSYTYDDAGRLILYEADEAADGVVDRRRSYAYDDDGNMLRYEEDDNADGMPELRFSSTYDDDGNMISYEEDQDGDGVADIRYDNTYDDGKMQSRQYYEGGELFSRRNYSYDEEGRLTRSELLTPDGAFDSAIGYTYDCSDEEMIQCSPDRAVEVPTHDAVCVDPFEAGVQPYSVDRGADPVVLTGEVLAPLLGREPERVAAFRYQDGWERIPVQVDERKTVAYTTIYDDNDCPTFAAPAGYDALVYADESTTVGSDPDPAIDDDDEVVVMLKDAGEAPESYTEPEGVEAGSGVRVDVSESEGGESLGTFYLFTHDGSLSPEQVHGYGSYTYVLEAGVYPDDFGFCSGPNREDSWFRSEYYERHFSDRWYSDAMKITAPGATGVDILDLHQVTPYGTGDCGGTTLNTGEGTFVNNISGPVRSIRSYMGAQSGPVTQRTHVFYERREDIITDLRVHSMPAESISDFADYAPEAAGMKYYNCFNPQGVVIDGVEDDIALGRANSSTVQDDGAWQMVSGDQGTLVLVNKTDASFDCDVMGFYRDDAVSGTDNCGDDSAWYGASGYVIETALPCTDAGCENDFRTTQFIYYLGPNLSVPDARQLSYWIYHPVEIAVSAASG